MNKAFKGLEVISGDQKVLVDIKLEQLGDFRVLQIRDRSDPTVTEHCSVSDAIDWFLPALSRLIHGLPRLVVYKDQNNIWERVLCQANGEFLGFACLESYEEILDSNVSNIAVLSLTSPRLH
ncbi:hypothetical protein [uncultured Photobacterium sp.]|uniref:hypothetical protein n=1 Tax=uncultured Photobacterium sp. TaxID=173973 RepID=UPI002625E840|nr:hypothetical protein [uncultured Photobacterium sp.]